MSTRYAKSSGMADRRIINEHILVPISGDLPNLDSLFQLNPVASTIYELACSGCNEDEIASRLVGDYDVDSATATADAQATLEELVDIGALVRTEGSS